MKLLGNREWYYTLFMKAQPKIIWIYSLRGPIALICIQLGLTMWAWPAPAPEPTRSEIGTPRVINGPMIGYVTPELITVWARVTGPYPFSVRFSEYPDMRAARETAVEVPGMKRDFAVIARMEGLKPGTTYYYQALVNGEPPKYLDAGKVFQVKTAPAPGNRARFTVGFGSCARTAKDPHQPIWQVVRDKGPDLFFWLGDNIYGDTLYRTFLEEEWQYQRRVPLLQPILRSTPQLATWDDHDYGLNGHDRENPIKEMALDVFKNYWANPAYGLADAPGVFFHYAYGGVDFFFLDGRTYRDPATVEDGPGKTFLGPAQLAWLQNGLQNSDAPFKVIICGSGWTTLKGPHEDTWGSALTERNALFNFIRDKNINGVVLLSGDTHQAELNCIPWSNHGGYDLYEMVSSPLAQGTSSKIQRQIDEIYIREFYQDAPNFGYLSFDLSLDDPELRFVPIDIFGEQGFDEFHIRASDLVNGKKTWPEKIDPGEARKREMGYYPDLTLEDIKL